MKQTKLDLLENINEDIENMDADEIKQYLQDVMSDESKLDKQNRREEEEELGIEDLFDCAG